MAELLSPTVVSNSFLAVFFICVAVGIWQVGRFLAPLLRENYEKKNAVHEANAKLAVDIVGIQGQQTTLMERQVQMANDHGVKLTDHGVQLVRHGELLDEHGKILNQIRDRVVVRGCHRGPHDEEHAPPASGARPSQLAMEGNA